MREGELIALQWRSIDFEDRVLEVGRSARRFKGRGVVMKDTKTHRTRTIALSSTALEILREQRRRQAEQKMRERLDYRDAGLVFADPLGRPLNSDTVGRYWRFKVAEPLGLVGVRVHDLRHRHASSMMAAGEAPKAIQERLGHGSAAFTMDVYGHLRVEEQRDAAERFDLELRGR